MSCGSIFRSSVRFHLAYLPDQSIVQRQYHETTGNEAFSCIRWLRRQPKQRVAKPCGETATSAMEELEAFRDHNAAKLTGEVVTYGSMVQRDRDETPAWLELCQDTVSSLEHITSLPELRRGCSRRKLHKPPGMDCLGGEVIRLFSDEIAEVLYPVFLKTTIKLDLPLRWRGGRAVDLFKSGDTKMMRNFRGIFLCDVLGKVGESNLRRGMRPILEKATLDTQLGGGFHDGDCDKAHIALRAAADCASIRKRALAALFLDVTGAFAAMQRALILEVPDSDEVLAAKLRSFNFTDAEVGEIMQGITDLGVWYEAGGSREQLLQISNAHRLTWFAYSGLPGIVHTKSGAGAGRPLADACFTLCVSKCLVCCERDFRAKGYCLDIQESFDPAVLGYSGEDFDHCRSSHAGVSHVDDAEFTLVGPAETLIPEIVPDAVATADRIFKQHGMELNFKPGKSNIVARFQGPGAVAARAHLEHSMDNKVPFTRPDGSMAFIEAVDI